jgi:hypothetical protein
MIFSDQNKYITVVSLNGGSMPDIKQATHEVLVCVREIIDKETTETYYTCGNNLQNILKYKGEMYKKILNKLKETKYVAENLYKKRIPGKDGTHWFEFNIKNRVSDLELEDDMDTESNTVEDLKIKKGEI